MSTSNEQDSATTPAPPAPAATPKSPTRPASPPKPKSPRRESDPDASSKYVSRKTTGLSKQRVAVLFGYVGTGYYGLQYDEKLPTIEKVLEEAMYKIGIIMESNHGSLERVQWSRSSRTDKGVHALGNVIALFAELPPDAFSGDVLGLKIADRLNEHLPPAIRVFSVTRVTRKFGPREQCAIRTYNIIWPRKEIDESKYSIEEIDKLMKQFEGHHNFHNFTRGFHSYKPISQTTTTATSTTTSITTSTTSIPTPSTSSPSSAPSSSSSLTSTPSSSSVSQDSTPVMTKEQIIIKTDTIETKQQQKPTTAVEEEDEEDGPDDVGGEAGEKEKKKQGKPRGIQPPARREDQMACFFPQNSYTRRMIYLGVESPFLLGGEEWVVFKFVGESFAYNQIRKMLGYVLHVAHGHVSPSSIKIALDSPFKINTPMTPGECLYLLGGTFLDRSHCMIDLFKFLPENNGPAVRYDNTAKAIPWHQLLEQSATSTAPGAAVLQRMKAFRDDVLHPHILSLYQANNTYRDFVEGLKDERFVITDLDHMQTLFDAWKKELDERKEKKRLRNLEHEERQQKRRKEDEEKRAIEKAKKEEEKKAAWKLRQTVVEATSSSSDGKTITTTEITEVETKITQKED